MAIEFRQVRKIVTVIINFIFGNDNDDHSGKKRKYATIPVRSQNNFPGRR